MAKYARVRRGMAVGAAGASLAVGAAACSSGPSSTGPSSTGTTTHAGHSFAGQIASIASAKADAAVFMAVTVEKGTQVQSVYDGTGALDSSRTAWSITARPIDVTSDKFDDTILDAGGRAYARTSSLPVALPKARWVTVSGPISTFDDGPVLPLTLPPSAAAAFESASSVHFARSHQADILGSEDEGYSASLSASAALRALAAHVPGSYVSIARTIFAGRSLVLSAYVSHSGRLAAFGYSCLGKGTLDTVTVSYYPLTSHPATIPAAPTSGVVSLPTFISALSRYQKHHG